MRLSKRQKSQERFYIVGGLLLLIVLAGAGATAYSLLGNVSSLDEKTLCPSSGPVGHTILLVDKTDPLNFTQKQAFHAILEDIVTRKVEPGVLLSVFVLGEDYTSTAKPLIDVCNPGDGRDKSEWTTNVKRLVHRYENSFRVPMMNLANELTSQVPAKQSPVLEMIQLVSINGFRAHAVEGPRRLILVSDMLHHTAGLSMYRGEYDYKSFVAHAYGRRMNSDLIGVEVELHYVLNAPNQQTRRHLKFWEDYFSNSGARIVSVRPLEG